MHRVSTTTTDYYRLRQIDNDGKETLSKVISIAAQSKAKVKVTPSVTSGILTIESTDNIEWVNIFNSIGQLVMSQKGIIHYPLSIYHLPSGVYIVRVATGGELVSEKIFKQ